MESYPMKKEFYCASCLKQGRETPCTRTVKDAHERELLASGLVKVLCPECENKIAAQFIDYSRQQIDAD